MLCRRAVLVLATVLCLLSGGCIETIDFEVERVGNNLVVDGMITDSPGPYTLKLRRTSGQEKISDPVSGASIIITDNLGNSEPYYEVSEGTYRLDGTEVTGVPERTYQIEIELHGILTYRSEPETMPATNAQDSIHYEFDTVETLSPHGVQIEKDVMRVYKETFVPETGDPLYLKWELQGAYKFTEYDFPDFLNAPPPACYVTENPRPQSIFLYDGNELAGGRLKTRVMAERELTYVFYTRYYANLIQYSITPGAYEYWFQVDQAINQSGTIFDVPPSNANSNIYNVDDPGEKVMGYFHAAAVDTTRFFVTQGDLPFRLSNPCRTPNRPHCTGCLEIENSSKEPPFYWLQD